mgnify:CR=1 FL=1
MTATASAPAAMTAGAVSSVMPPMATSGREAARAVADGLALANAAALGVVVEG